jgi:alkanesulfonate monooxygenase SsuD/methylene tetrahydromethanopterin reductase-like flavin-dependent oxidoreductase (luciferase family)
MKFGIFYEHQLPRPWRADSEHRLLKEALEQVELADRLGIDYVWEVEHHFLEEYSHSSAPEVFLAACSQRTSHIRLGHGIVQLPQPYNHTARVVERIATLDLISDGRVEFGTGESSSEAELGGFGVDAASKREQWNEALEVAARMMVETPFAGWDGEHFQMPPRNVIPKPLQRPHPPLWVACSRRETIHLAAERGIGALSFTFGEPAEAKFWVDDYYATLASSECVPAGFAVNAQLAVVLPFMCHRDEATAVERGIDGAHFFAYSLGHYYVFGRHRPGGTDLWSEFQERRSELGFDRAIATRVDNQPLGVQVIENGIESLRGAVGTPGQIRELLRRYEEVGVDQVIFAATVGGTRHEHICEALELFAREVLPEFRERDARQRQQRLDRLAPAIEAALKRRSPPRPPDPSYSFPARGGP